jgi:murein DD-endopeptidase
MLCNCMVYTLVSRVARCCSVVALVAFVDSVNGSAQSPARQRIDQSVEMRVLQSPVIVDIDGTPHLVHELHLTNLRREPVSLQRVQVLVPGESDPLADLQDADLAGRVGRPGLPPAPPEPLVLGPGLRAVVYFWTAVPADRRDVREVSHRAELTITASDGIRHTQVTGATTSVSGASALVIDPPLGGGPWVAIYNPSLVGGHRTSLYTLDGQARIPGRFAIDWIRAPEEGREGGSATLPDPMTATGFGAAVLAVADARVAIAVDDMPDLPPGALTPPAPVPLERASGNYVALDLGAGRFAFYEHLRQGSLVVRTGGRVRRGQPIAQLGSSGSTSIGPHLHFHVADAAATLAAEGMPFVLERFGHLGGYRSFEALRAGEPWTPAAPGGSAARRREHPASLAVVRF